MMFSCDPSPSENIHTFHDPEMVTMHDKAWNRKKKVLLGYLRHPDADYRREAALLLGTLQDTSTVDELADLLDDPRDKVRRAAIYSIGQCGHFSGIAELLRYLGQTRSQEVAEGTFEALGKLIAAGNSLERPEAQAALKVFEEFVPQNDDQFEDWARGVMRLHKSEADTRRMLDRIPGWLPGCDDDSREILAWTLAGAPANWVTSNSEMLMNWIRTELSENIRVPLLGLLGKTGTAEAEEMLVVFATQPGNSGTHTLAAVRALRFIARIRPEVLGPLLQHPDDYVVEQLFHALAEREERAWDDRLAPFTSTRNLRVQVAALRYQYLCGEQEASARIARLARTADTTYDRAAAVQALAADSSHAVYVLEQFLLPEEAPAVRYAAAECLASMHPIYRDSFTASLFLPAWNTGDAGVQAVLAGWVASPHAVVRNSGPIVDAIIRTLDTLQLPRDIETRDAIAAACAALGHPVPPIKPYAVPPVDWDLVRSLPAEPGIEVVTNKGSIFLRLYTEDCPGSVARFIQLVRDGFYRGKYFHRVVPGFVIQGGCPRGDGMGSLDEVIRSEFHRHRYTRGSIGLASAGKDTESCQWFITHVPAYSLEGRYTTFGKVTSGMDVVDTIRVGDVILDIREVDSR
jgi:cyclophilin family peptidyl-prolyl cis-trans isomerase